MTETDRRMLLREIEILKNTLRTTLDPEKYIELHNKLKKLESIYKSLDKNNDTPEF